VFLGLALEKQEKYEDAEKAYNFAAKIKPDDPLAWRGLVTLYEKQAGRKVDQYHVAALRLAEIYMEAYVLLDCYDQEGCQN
jgi:superkiller protein 3